MAQQTASPDEIVIPHRKHQLLGLFDQVISAAGELWGWQVGHGKMMLDAVRQALNSPQFV